MTVSTNIASEQGLYPYQLSSARPPPTSVDSQDHWLSNDVLPYAIGHHMALRKGRDIRGADGRHGQKHKTMVFCTTFNYIVLYAIVRIAHTPKH